MRALALSWNDPWHTLIGDPDLVGWAVTIGYFVACWLCWRASRHRPAPTPPPVRGRPMPQPAPEWLDLVGDPQGLLSGQEQSPTGKQPAAGGDRGPGHQTPVPNTRRFWLLFAALMLVLGLNKQLDLQTLLTEIGRSAARAQGWYPVHRAVQFWFVVGIAALGFVSLLALLIAVRRALAELVLPLTGAVFLITFVTIRAASFHHVDTFLSQRPGGVSINNYLEALGIALIACGAAWHPRPRNPRNPRPRNPRPRNPRN